MIKVVGLLLVGLLLVGSPDLALAKTYMLNFNPMQMDFGGRPRKDPPSIGAWEYYEVDLQENGINVVELKPGIVLGVFPYPLPDTIDNLNKLALGLANQKWVVKNYINITTTGEHFVTEPPESGYPKYILMWVLPKPPTNPRVVK
jgi:hypothetical protein